MPGPRTLPDEKDANRQPQEGSGTSARTRPPPSVFDPFRVEGFFPTVPEV